jgi:glycosyltransferase involved in cell wall biosynthesis
MRIIFITPNLSTGGMPEYLRKKVELLKSENDIWVLELHTEWAYRIIRDKIEALLGDRLIAVNSNYEKMWNIIQKIQPDIIHFEELSDYNVPYDILDRIYSHNRKWKVFETFHDSSIESLVKRYLPDKLLVVSPWQQKMMMGLGIPIEVINHEIDGGERNRSKLVELGLDPNQKHVMQVGIFSRRKNQSETFEMAKRMPDVQFHFLGGLAENYKFYWEPLLANKPENCHIWNERNDVERFYQCFDAVIFPSIGNYGDRETNPLVIREAIAWNIPLLVRDLPVYMGMYREGSLVKFMGDDINSNVTNLYSILNSEPSNRSVQEEFIPDFNITFNSSENKLNIEYLQLSEFPCKVLVKDLTSSGLIYSFDAHFCDRNSYWCIPDSIENRNFYQDKSFEGFLIEFVQDGKTQFFKRYKINRDMKSAFVISTFPQTKSITDATVKCIESIKKLGYDVIVTSHIPIPKEIASIADWCVSDNNNILTTHTYYNKFWSTFSSDGSAYRADINLTTEGNNHYHGPSCYTNYWNGCALANNLGYNVVYLINYDYLVLNSKFIDDINQHLSDRDAYLLKSRDEEGERVLTAFMAVKPSLFLQLPKVTNASEYNSLPVKFGSVSNGLENLLFNALKNFRVYFEELTPAFETNFEHLDFSRVEYQTILPVSANQFASVFISQNSSDSRILEYKCFLDNKIIRSEIIEIENKVHFLDINNFESGHKFTIRFEIKEKSTNETLSVKDIEVDDFYFSQLNKNGLLTIL